MSWNYCKKNYRAIEKKDARILWNVNEDGEINELLVAEFKEGKVNKWPMELYTSPTHKGGFSFDIGNASVWWKNETLVSVLLTLMEYGFEEYNDRIITMAELYKVKEWRPALESYRYMPSDYEAGCQGRNLVSQQQIEDKK